jgi:glycerol-3-phosphate dehydrogenase
VKGIRARDAITGRELEIAAAVVVNAAGGDVERLLRTANIPARIPMLRQMNLVTRRDAGEEALGGRSSSGRNLFLVPWRERALFGTWESGRVWDPADTSVAAADVAAFMTELNQAFPALDLSIADVTLVHHGLVPAATRGSRVVLEPHEQLRDHAADGADGLLTIAGTKFTTARASAERVTDRVVAKLGKPAAPCRTATTVLPGGAIRDLGLAIADGRREHDAGLPTDTIPHLIGAYGSRFRDVLELAVDKPEWRTRIAHDSPVIGAQLVHAVRHEMAITLADAVLRRTPLGALGDPGPEALARAAAIVGHELRWSDERQQQEIAAVGSFYGTLNALKT